MFWNGFFLRLTFFTLYAQLMGRTFDWWALLLMGYFTATPICVVLEMAMRAEVKVTSARNMLYNSRP